MRPVVLGNAPNPPADDPSGFLAWVLAALKEIERSSNDTLQNDSTSSGAAMATVHGAAADEIVYFTSETATDFTGLSAFSRTLLADATAAAWRATLNVFQGNFTGHGDSVYAILATDSVVYTNAAFTASRTWTLPLASTVAKNTAVYVVDAQGTVTLTNTLVLATTGADAFSGTGVTSLTSASSAILAISDGVSKWYTFFVPGGVNSILNRLSQTQGTVIYRGAANWAALTPGTSGTFLKTNGAAADPAWAAVPAFTQTDFISGIIKSPLNQDYRIVEYIPYAATLTSFVVKTASGTLTATLKINTTAVTGGAPAVTSTQSVNALTANNVTAATDRVVLTVSAVSSPVDFSFTLVFTRALA